MEKYKASLASELKSLQVGIEKLKQEEQELTSHIQRLNSQELEILRLVEGERRRKQAARAIYSRITITTETAIGNYSTST